MPCDRCCYTLLTQDIVGNWWQCRPSQTMPMPCFSFVCTVATTFISRGSLSLVWEWTLKCCGHHPFQDGRIARHARRHSPQCLGGAPCSTCPHAICVCPLIDLQRHTWLERLSLQRVSRFGDAELLRWIVDLFLVPYHHSAVNARAYCVAALSQAARSLCAGLLR